MAPRFNGAAQLSASGAAKIREWQRVAGAPYGTYGARKTANAKRQLALYSSGIGDSSLYEPAPAPLKLEGPFVGDANGRNS